MLLAEDDGRAALATLRRAWAAWQEIDAPYEAARVRVLVGLTCRRLGDKDGAQMELDAACCIFEELGARPDVARIDALSGEPASGAPALTARERQVVKLVASGKINRTIAAELRADQVRRILQRNCNECSYRQGACGG